MKKNGIGLSRPLKGGIKKLLLMTKLTIFLSLFFVVQLSANVYSQTRLTVDSKNKTVKEVLLDIENQSEFRFFYNEQFTDLNRYVKFDIVNESIDKVMDELFESSNFTYKIMENNLIVITPGEIQQDKTISGTVTDESGQPLPGVTAIIKGTTKGTVTNSDGKYSLSNVPDNATLVFSFVGMLTQELEVGSQLVINVSMQVDAIGIEEVVAIGYGTIKKSDLTGSVASVSQKELTAYPSTNALQAMQGRAAGVNIQLVNGEPGGDYKITIRGATSINASSNPLFVIDGLVGGTMPPPEDIASIEILKDASASAIYGSRGANGVVMITTKSGKSGKTLVNINSYYSFQSEIGRLEVLNARDFAEYINEARNTDFYDLNAINIDTDWQEMIFQPGHTQNHQLSVSGGTDKVQYYVSGIYFDQKGVIKSSAFDRFSLTSNLKLNLTEHIRLNLNSTIQSSNQDGTITQTGGGPNDPGVVTSAQRFDPNLGVLDENGIYTTSKVGIAAFENPMAGIDGKTQENRQDNIQLNLKAEFDLTKGLIFYSTFGTIMRNSRDGTYDSRITTLGLTNNGQGSLSYRRNFNFLTEQYLNYNFKAGEKSDFVLTGGYSYQDFKIESFTASNSGFITDALGFWNLGVGTNLITPSSNYTESEITSFYGRANYNYAQRYLLTVTGRYDGASQFSEGNKWSFFPSGAFSWNIGNEAFYPKNKVLSGLKLRTSYGLTGNQAIGPYQSLASISSSFFVVNNTSVSSVRPTSIANKDLTWETTAQFNLGLDFDFFERRISLSGDYYNKQTNDLLFSVPIPGFSGFQSRLDNIGEIENKGLEFQLNSKNLVNEFKWSTSFNLTLNRNKVLSLPYGVDIIFDSAPGFPKAVENSILRETEPVGSFYGYVYEGVYQEGDTFIPGAAFETYPGGEKFADLNNDGVLDSNDRKIIGDPNPKAVWGFNNDFSYKGFSANIFFQAFTGGDMLNIVAMEMGRLSGNANATTDALNRWTPENTNTNIPKATSSRVSRTSTRYVEDGSFVRLKNLSIAYDFAPGLLSKLKISTARIYLSGQNLLTFTNYSGVDPEVAFRSSNINLGLDYGSYPNTTSYTIGINLGF